MVRAIDTIASAQTLIYIRDNTQKLTFCTTQPTTYTEATVTKMLAELVLEPGDITVDSTTPGTSRLIVHNKADIPILTTGSIGHIAFVNDDDTEVIFVTISFTKAVTSGKLLSFPEFYIYHSAPVAAP